MLFSELLKSNLDKALELFRDGSLDLLSTSSNVIIDASSDPGLRKKLWVAAETETNAIVQQELTKGLIAGEFFRVLRSISPQGPFQEVGTTVTPTFEDPIGAGGTAAGVYYKILPVNAGGAAVE